MQHQGLAFTVAVLLLGSYAVLSKADSCYQQADFAYFSMHFGGSFGIKAKPCPDTKGCYEFYTKGPGHIQYKAGCDAAACPAASGFDASLHTCVKCKEKTADVVAAAGDVICSSASIVPTLAPGKSAKKVCPYRVKAHFGKPGGTYLFLNANGNVYCNTDTKCGTQRWLLANTGLPVANYTGCISDCDKSFQEAGGSATDKCVECNDDADCELKQPQPKDAVVISGPTSKKAGTTTPKGAPAGPRAASAAAAIGIALAVTSCISRLQ